MITTLAEMTIGNPASNVGVSGTVRYYASADFTDTDGTLWKGGAIDSKNYFLSNTWTLVSGEIVVPAKSGFPTTSDSLPGGARITAVLYNSTGKNIGRLFENWAIPATEVVLDREFLLGYNGRPYPVRAVETLSKADFLLMMNAGIDTAVGTLNDASATVKGRTKLSVAPVSASNPIAVGDNDPRLLGSGFYFLSNYASLAAAVTAIGSDRATLLIGDIAAVSANLTIPANISLLFTNDGGVQPANGVTVLIQGAIEAEPVKIFYNATSGQGTIAFAAGANYLDTQNLVQKEFWAEWWGPVGDNDNAKGAANAAGLNAAFAALPHGGTMRLAGKFYPIDSGITFHHKFQCTLLGNDSQVGYSDNNTKPIFVYRGANGGTALTLSNVYSCTFRGFGVYSNDGINLANGADKGIYLTYVAGGYPSLTSRCTLDALTIWSVNTRDTWRGLEINDLVGANNEHHTVRECWILGGGDATTEGRGYGIYQGHSQVKAIEYIRNNIGNVGTGILVSGSLRCVDNSFNSCYVVYHFSYLIDANFVMGDDIETITRYIETEQHPGASTCVFIGNRVEAIKAVGDAADDFIIQTVGKFSFFDTGFLNGDIYNIRNFGPYAFIGDGASDVLFSNCSLQLGQSTFTHASVGQATMVCTVIEGSKVYRYGGSASSVGERTAESTPALASPRKTLNLAGSTAQAVAPMYLGDGEIQFWGIHAVPYFTLEVVGTTGATIRRFAIVGADSAGREGFTSRPNGEFFVGVTNANATLSGSDYIKFTWPSQFPIPAEWRIYEVNPANSFEWRLAATTPDAGGLYQTYNLTANPAGSFVSRPFLNQSALLAINAQVYFPNEGTFTDGDTTPSVGIGNDFVEADTGATNTTTFDDGTVGQIIRIRATTANRTLVNGATLVTGTGANVTMVAGNIYSFVLRAGAWRRIT